MINLGHVVNFYLILCRLHKFVPFSFLLTYFQLMMELEAFIVLLYTAYCKQIVSFADIFAVQRKEKRN